MITALLLIQAITANAFEFSSALHCNAQGGNKKGPWCLESAFKKGRRVSFLSHEKCQAATSDPSEVATEESTFQGTLLADFDCPDATEPEPVVLDTDVKELKTLEIREVLNDRIPQDMEANIRRHPFFEKLLVRAPDHERLGPPVLSFHLREVIGIIGPRKTFVATFTDAGELPFLVQGGQVTPLVTSGGSAAMGIKAIRLNGAEFIVLNLCDIGGGGCGETYRQIK